MIYFFLISIIALTMGISLWTPGGIMLLDFIISDTPNIAWYRPLGNMFTYILGGVLGYEWGSKVAIFLILLSAGYLGILLSRYVISRLEIPLGYKSMMIEILGILFLINNPYAYERMMTQPLIYAGIVALGYGCYYLLLKRRYIHAGIALAIALSLFPHASYMIVLIMGLYIALYVRSVRGILDVSRILGCVILLNLNWMIATTLGNEHISKISEFSGENFIAFATQAIAPLDVFMTNILLYGFWGEQYDNHFAHVEVMSPYWYAGGIFILLIIIAGGILLYHRSEKQLLSYLVLMSGCSLIFAVGQSSMATQGISQWMIAYVPFWQGYREPQKWTGLIMIAECMLFLTTVAYVYKRYIEDRVIGGAVFFALLMVLYVWSPGVLGGYRNQMRTSVYPTGYYSVRDILRNTPQLSGVLVLPWHAYIGCEWIQRPTIANPIASMYRGLPMILPDTIEVGDTLYANNLKNPARIGIDEFVQIGDPLYLDTENISHIILIKGCTGEAESNDVLSRPLATNKLSLVYNDRDIILYVVNR